MWTEVLSASNRYILSWCRFLCVHHSICIVGLSLKTMVIECDLEWPRRMREKRPWVPQNSVTYGIAYYNSRAWLSLTGYQVTCNCRFIGPQVIFFFSLLNWSAQGLWGIMTGMITFHGDRHLSTWLSEIQEVRGLVGRTRGRIKDNRDPSHIPRQTYAKLYRKYKTRIIT